VVYSSHTELAFQLKNGKINTNERNKESAVGQGIGALIGAKKKK
jgi:hypothetical protein